MSSTGDTDSDSGLGILLFKASAYPTVRLLGEDPRRTDAISWAKPFNDVSAFAPLIVSSALPALSSIHEVAPELELLARSGSVSSLGPFSLLVGADPVPESFLS